jgi:adenylosuccinate lyase
MSREGAYRAVQRNAMDSWSGGRSFRDLLGADQDVAKHLSPAELDQLFDLGQHTRHVDTIFARVFGAA